MRKNNVINKFLFLPNFLFLQNDAILINPKLFFQEKESSQLYHSQFLKINSLMAETIKSQFLKTEFS